MKTTYSPQCSIIANTKPVRRIPYGKITAGLAVMAWLTLAGQAFAQSTNQWAPIPAPTVSAAAVIAAPVQVWGNGAGVAVYAPFDLDQRLSTGNARPVVQSPEITNPGFGQPAPVFAPAYPATQMVSPMQARQAPSAPQGYNPTYQNMPYANGPNGIPFGGGYAPFNGGYGNGAYGGSYANGPYSNGPYGSGPSNWGNNWGGPGTNNSFGGIPFFGGSPFSFW